MSTVPHLDKIFHHLLWLQVDSMRSLWKQKQTQKQFSAQINWQKNIKFYQKYLKGVCKMCDENFSDTGLFHSIHTPVLQSFEFAINHHDTLVQSGKHVQHDSD